MSFSAQYPPVLTEAGDLTSEVLGKYNQEFQYLYTNLLSALFSATTGHAHTGNGSDGAQLTAASIASDAITTLKILNEAVTAAKLATDAVTADKILADAVTTVKILNGAITTAKFAADAQCPLAGKVANALTVNGTEFDGSAAQSVIIQSHGSQLFTSDGTFVVPDGVTTVYVTGCGAGGGGAGGNYDLETPGGAGGAGGSVFRQKVNVSAGSPLTVTIGTGGVGGNWRNAFTGYDGSAGGATSFHSYVTINGGGGGKGNSAPADVGDYSAYFSKSWFNRISIPYGVYGSSAGGTASVAPSYGCGGDGGLYYNAPAGIGKTGAQGFLLVEW